MVSIINPSAIAETKAEVVKPDLRKFDIAKQQVGLVVAELKRFQNIRSKAEQDEAMIILKSASEVDKAIEKKRKELVAPWNDAAKEINNYVKELIVDLSPAIDKTKQACLDFQKEEQQRVLQERTTQRHGQLAALGFTYDAATDKFSRENIGEVLQREIENYDAVAWEALLDQFAGAIGRQSQQQSAQLQEERELAEMFGDEDDLITVDQKIISVETSVKAPVITTQTVSKLNGLTKRWTFEITDVAQVPREYIVINETAVRNAIKMGIRDIPGIRIFQSESLTIK